MKTKNRRYLKITIALLLLLAVTVSILLAVFGTDGLRRLFRRGGAINTHIDDDDIREAFADILEKNPEAEEYVRGYEGVMEYDLSVDIYKDGAKPEGKLPYLTQWDSRWGYCPYSGGLIGYTGCGPTCLSMVLIGLTGDGTKTPAYVADFAMRHGYSVDGNGTAWTLFSEGAEQLGLHSEELILWEATMRTELGRGHPIICIMGPGHFTTTGHYIVLYGCDDEGFFVYDPYRPSNCRTWSYDDISGEIRNLWAYS